MGLLENLLGSGSGNTTNQSQVHQGLLEHVMGMVSNPQTGGLNGLLDQLKAGGLAGAVETWVGNGPNQAVSSQQVAGALGQGQIRSLRKSSACRPIRSRATCRRFSPNSSATSRLMARSRNRIWFRPPLAC